MGTLYTETWNSATPSPRWSHDWSTFASPGPSQSPVTQLLRFSFKPLEFLEDCAARYGETFTIRPAGLGTLVLITRPDEIREIFKGDPAVLHAGEGNALLSSVVGETSVLVLDEAPLSASARRCYHRSRRAHAHVLQRDADRGGGDRPAMDGAGVVCADKAMRAVTLRVILRAAVGLEPGDDFRSLQISMSRLLGYVRHPFALVMWNLFPLQRYQDSRVLPFYRFRRKFDTLLREVIAAQRALGLEARPDSLLSDLLETKYDDGSSMTDVELRDAIVTVLAAGHDTTALALAWAFELILDRADVIERIEAELDTVCGEGLPQIEHMPALTYLDAVIRESLRVRNVIPFVGARAQAQLFGRWIQLSQGRRAMSGHPLAAHARGPVPIPA